MIGRKEENGPQGDGINREVAFTLDTSDRHAVYAMTTGSFTQVDQEKSPPLMARDYKDPPLVGRNDKSSEEEGAAYAMDRACFSAGQNAQYSINIGKEKVPTLTAQGPGAVTAPETGYIVAAHAPRMLPPAGVSGRVDGTAGYRDANRRGNPLLGRGVRGMVSCHGQDGQGARPKPNRQMAQGSPHG